MVNEDTIVALATPAGVGAIGVIRLSGKNAISITAKIFSNKKLMDSPSHTIHYGFIEFENRKVDEVMVSIFRAPKSFTTEDVIEISCHGSVYIQQQIIQLIIQQGGRAARAGEFTLRAFLNGRIDLSQAEAVADIILSENEASLDLALKQMRGGFTHILKNLRQELIDFVALIELELDFGEEDVEFANREKLVQLINQILNVIQPLLDSFNYGNVIKRGVNTVIAGRPNAGKSTLLNALLQEERAIVSDIAGTTRDTIEESMVINGIEFKFIDTAGIRKAKDQIETIGIEKTFEKIKEAALLIYLFDPEEMKEEQVIEATKDFESKNVTILFVANKMDLASGETEKKYSKIQPVFISAKEKLQINLLKEKLYEAVIGNKKIGQQDFILTNIRHFEALSHSQFQLQLALQNLENNISSELIALDLRRALNYLGEVSGQVTNEDILGSIFGRFCIGK